MDAVAISSYILKLAQDLKAGSPEADGVKVASGDDAYRSLIHLASSILAEDLAEDKKDDLPPFMENKEEDKESVHDVNALVARELSKLAKTLSKKAETSGSGVPDEDNDLEHPADYANWQGNPTKEVSASQKKASAKVATKKPAAKVASNKVAKSLSPEDRVRIATELLKYADELEKIGL